MRVLLIEDDESAAKALEVLLGASGVSVYACGLGEEGVDMARTYDYDLILLDLNLPDMGGLEVLRTLRQAKVDTPVLILSGTSGVDSKVRSLGGGADDYLTKPFHREELVARIHAIVRRAQGHAHSVVQIGDLVVNLTTKSVQVGELKVHLTGKEYEIIELLALRKGAAISKEMFLNHLYGGMDEPEAKIIDVYICKIRKKLELAGSGRSYIATIWGRGYMIAQPSGLDLPAAA